MNQRYMTHRRPFGTPFWTEGWALYWEFVLWDRQFPRDAKDKVGMLTGLFVTLQTADRHPSKPHPSMVYQALADAGTDARNAVVIGDTVYDIHMGRAAGTRTVGVNWGYHSVEDLREAGADYIAESMDDLKTYLMDFA
jgi:phosphoglycolate phosphatase-like HAD superfamily hydrolase